MIKILFCLTVIVFLLDVFLCGIYFGKNRMERIAISKGYGTLQEETLDFVWLQIPQIKASDLKIKIK